MYTVVRQYSGPNVSQFFDEAESKREDIERLIRGVPGVVSYTLLRTGDGGISVTVCQDKAGTDESVRVVADWIKQNMTTQSNPPVISEGSTIVQFSSQYATP